MTTSSRPVVTVENPTELIVRTADLAGQAGATTFELAYDARDRDLAPGEDVPADEWVRWTVSTVVRRKLKGRRPTLTTYTAHRDRPPGAHGDEAAVAHACIDLLEQLGINVVVASLPDIPT